MAISRAGINGPKHALPAGRTLHTPQAWHTRVPEELYPTTYITEQSVHHLERYAGSGSPAPFFLCCSFPDPHHPFAPPGRYFDLYNPIPTNVSRREFNRYIAPHLKKPTKGPTPKLSLYKIFNYILYVLHTGLQWYQLKTRKNEPH